MKKRDSLRSVHKVKLNFQRSRSSSRTDCRVRISKIKEIALRKKSRVSFPLKTKCDFLKNLTRAVKLISHSTPCLKLFCQSSWKRQKEDSNNATSESSLFQFLFLFDFSFSTLKILDENVREMFLCFAKLARLTLQLVNIFTDEQCWNPFEFLFFD